LVTKGQSQYGGTRLFADEAAAGFRSRGHQVEVLDLGSSKAFQDDLAAAAGGPPFDLVFSINILGNFRSVGGATMAQLFGCPHVVWHTDYVLGAWDRLKETPPDTVLLVVDPTHVQALAAAAGADRHRARFFPHPAVGAPVADEPDVEAFMAARPIPVLWSGGFQGPLRPWASASPATQTVMDGAVDLAMSVEWMPPHIALAQVFRSHGWDVMDPDKRQSLAGAWMIDAEVRSRRRHAFLMALADSGVELHICGQMWEPHLHLFKGATYHGIVEMTRMVELMRQSRVVLNTNGNFGAGSHERPFSASLAGAATFSDISRYYTAQFQPEENIVLFSWLDLPGAMEALTALSADPERCWRLARSAKRLTLDKHTWDHRVDDILEAAGLPRTVQ
jgi:hypothetical protein